MNVNKLIIECPEGYKPLLRPISEESLCGESLEYKNDFILLLNELEPRIGAEFGNFVETIEPLNFVKILKQAEALLKLSIDIRLIIIILRCRLHINGLSALAEGLQALRYAINEWPEAIYPQLWDEGEYVPFLRANAFSDLDSNEGLTKELRAKKITLNSIQKITLSEFEKASFGLSDGPITKQQLADNRENWSCCSEFHHLQLAAEQLSALKNELSSQQMEVKPDFKALGSLLNLFNSTELSSNILAHDDEQPLFDETQTITIVDTDNDLSDESNFYQKDQTTAEINTVTANDDRIANRKEAVIKLQKVRSWFLANEPGSPVIDLLMFTEKLVGKNFLALLKILPAELIHKLEPEEEK